MKRNEVLTEAMAIVVKGRHGAAENVFADIAALWSIYLGVEVRPHDVSALMALLKIARLKQQPAHGDNWVDLAGYAATGAELVA